jgi:hypothetical protein
VALAQAALFLVFGIGLLVVDYRALTTGWLPCGRGLTGRLELRKSERPLAFWAMFTVYGAGGVWLAVLALQLLAGRVEPLPLQ